MCAYLAVAVDFAEVRGWLAKLGDSEGIAVWDSILAVVERSRGQDIFEKLDNLSEEARDELWDLGFRLLDTSLDRTPLLAAYARKHRDQFARVPDPEETDAGAPALTLDEIFDLSDEDFLDALERYTRPRLSDELSDAVRLVAEFLRMDADLENDGMASYMEAGARFAEVRGWFETLGDADGLRAWGAALSIVRRAPGADIREKLAHLSETNPDKLWALEFRLRSTRLRRAPLLAAYARKHRDQFT